MPAQQPWSSKDIILALNAKGWSLRQLATDLRMSPSGVSYGIRTGSSFRVRERISELLGTNWMTLWPARCPPQWRDGDPP